MRWLRALVGTAAIAVLLMAGQVATGVASMRHGAQLRECGNQFIGVANEQGISFAKACAVSDAARAAGVWACVAGEHFPVPGLKRHHFRSFVVSITHPDLDIWFLGSRQRFMLSVQCS
jgi:hypothetical protein